MAANKVAAPSTEACVLRNVADARSRKAACQLLGQKSVPDDKSQAIDTGIYELYVCICIRLDLHDA